MTNGKTATAATERAVFYWDGIDHEDLHCVCGTPHPTVDVDPSNPDDQDPPIIATCGQCGAVADLGTDDEGCWIYRVREAKEAR
jgi:hypothetical protein